MVLVYREESPTGWSATVEATWAVTERVDGFDLSGTCPTCGDTCSVPIRMASGVPGSDRKATDGGPEQLAVICNCAVEHPGAPPERRGCGRGGRLLLHTS